MIVGQERLDCEGAVVEPGHVNAHTHIYSGLAPLGLPAPQPPPENFVQILERVWWRLDRALDADALRASARLYVAEALLRGTTTLIDHHESPEFIEGSLDVLADAVDELGGRALLCYGATERNGGPDEAHRGLSECARLLRDRAGPRIAGAVALHASFTVSDETIRVAATLCHSLDAVMHVHLAEDGADVEDAKRRGYAGPFERLLELGALPPGSILAHGVHMNRDQVRRAADGGCWFVQNPRSNLGNRVGYPDSLAATDRVALGTDGYPADMLDESRALPSDVDVKARLRSSHAIAGDLFGHDAVDGDLRVVDDQGVRHVVVGDRVVVRDRELVSADLAAIRRDAEVQAEALWARMRALA